MLTGLSLTTQVAAQDVAGWRLHRTSHFLLYTVDGSPGARDVDGIAARLEQIHALVLAPLGLPPVEIIYPLYPSAEQFQRDWWKFAAQGYGDLVHGWGLVYDGDPATIEPYEVTRAVVTHAFPRAIPLLRWGLADALSDRAAGVNAHRHVRALTEAGQQLPGLRAIIAPSDFGQALPESYPMAVSFVAYLLDAYGLSRTAEFVDRASYRYFDFPELFATHFGTPFTSAEAAWRQRVTTAPAPGPLDLRSYFSATRFVYRTSLAGSPARLLLGPRGAVIVTEAFRTAVPLRRLDLGKAVAHVEAAERAAAEAERKHYLTTTAVRALIGLLVVTPILLAVGWLLWPTIRAYRAG